MRVRIRAALAAAVLGLCGLAVPASAQVSPAPSQSAVVSAAFDHGPLLAALKDSGAVSVPGLPLALADLVASFRAVVAPDEAADCLAKAIYFEARGESLEGQLAVAEVVLNRAASGNYPSDICGVITQRAQFSFIRNGAFPAPDTASAAWQTALAVTHVAQAGLARVVASDVMWYHADYVAPKWGRFHTQVARIGAHIFYS